MTIIDSHRTARTAARDDRAELNRVLAAAFLDDPVLDWIVPDRDARLRLLPDMFDAFADAFARHGATRLLPEGDGGAAGVAGVAMWAPPGAPPVHPEDEEAMGNRLAELSGPHLDRMSACLEVFEAAHPTEPVWFLQFLGVDPVHQGRGVGSRLLREVFEVADRNGEAAYLEATSDRNRALYEHHGFRWVADLPLPDGPTAYAMWRSPAGA